jgi:hypothetical protein
MRAIPKQVVEIAQQLKDGEQSRRYRVRGVLKWFRASRRGANVISDIKTVLANLGLDTDPSLDEAKIDERIRFRLSAQTVVNNAPSTAHSPETLPQLEPMKLRLLWGSTTLPMGEPISAHRPKIS